MQIVQNTAFENANVFDVLYEKVQHVGLFQTRNVLHISLLQLRGILDFAGIGQKMHKYGHIRGVFRLRNPNAASSGSASARSRGDGMRAGV